MVLIAAPKKEAIKKPHPASDDEIIIGMRLLSKLLNNVKLLKMRNLLTKNSFLLLMSVSILLFSQCESEQILTSEESSSIIDKIDNVKVSDSILIFESKEDFIKTTDAIANLNDFERQKWEEKLGFISQRRFISIVMQDELDIDSINMLNNSIQSSHSRSYKSALDKGIIEIFNPNTYEEYWDYSIFNRGFIDFVNLDGFFAIGDTLYHAGEKYLKAMHAKTFENRNLLLETNDSQTNQIRIINQRNVLKGTSPGAIWSKWIESNGSRNGKKGEKRIKIGIYLDVRYLITSNNRYQFFHEAYILCQERNFWQNWKYKFTHVDLYGNWNLSVYYYPQYYSNNYEYHGSVNNFKSSINPETGSTAPYQSYFEVLPNYQNQNVSYQLQNNYQPIFESYSWSALRDGGCCGLYVELPRDIKIE